MIMRTKFNNNISSKGRVNINEIATIQQSSNTVQICLVADSRSSRTVTTSTADMARMRSVIQLPVIAIRYQRPRCNALSPFENKLSVGRWIPVTYL